MIPDFRKPTAQFGSQKIKQENPVIEGSTGYYEGSQPSVEPRPEMWPVD